MNPRPARYKCAALPTELRQHIEGEGVYTTRALNHSFCLEYIALHNFFSPPFFLAGAFRFSSNPTPDNLENVRHCLQTMNSLAPRMPLLVPVARLELARH